MTYIISTLLTRTQRLKKVKSALNRSVDNCKKKKKIAKYIQSCSASQFTDGPSEQRGSSLTQRHDPHVGEAATLR